MTGKWLPDCTLACLSGFMSLLYNLIITSGHFSYIICAMSEAGSIKGCKLILMIKPLSEI